jgi:hypothetical protein
MLDRLLVEVFFPILEEGLVVSKSHYYVTGYVYMHSSNKLTHR